MTTATTTAHVRTQVLRVRADDGAWLATWVHEPVRPRPGAPTVVLVHGWVLTHAGWGPVRDRLLAEGLRVVTYDLRGHGASQADGPRRLRQGAVAASMGRLGDDLAQVVRATVPAGDVVLAGHSMGGMAVLAHVGEHPLDRVQGVLLLSTTAGEPPMHRHLPELLLAAAAARVPRLKVGWFVNDRLQRWLAFAAGADPQLVHQARTQVAATTVATFGRYHRAMRVHDSTEAVARLTDVPTRIVVGEHDRLTPLAHSEALAARLPEAVLDVLPGFGHMLPLEAPGLVAEHLLALAGAR